MCTEEHIKRPQNAIKQFHSETVTVSLNNSYGTPAVASFPTSERTPRHHSLMSSWQLTAFEEHWRHNLATQPHDKLSFITLTTNNPLQPIKLSRQVPWLTLTLLP